MSFVNLYLLEEIFNIERASLSLYAICILKRVSFNRLIEVG